MTKKITVSLPDELVAEADEAVRTARAPSVSAYVAEALRQRSGRESLAAVVADLVAEFGEPSRADRERARSVLRGHEATRSAGAKQRPLARRRAV
ncbi:MAG: ribbon-helix-helix domain-containing protein [Mycobacteriales bacterium]